MLIKLKVKTKQQLSKLEFKENQYIAHVKALPVNNKANLEVIDLTAKFFRVPKSKVSIKSGANSNKKTLNVDKGEELLPAQKPHFLFVCGQGKIRSRTAAQMYKNSPYFNARYAGVSQKSPHPLSSKDIAWASTIFVFEDQYKDFIVKKFGRDALPEILNIDIPDEYTYMDPELVRLISQAILN